MAFSPLSKTAWLALICLTLQYSILVLVIHKALTFPPPLFRVSLAVFLSETLKCILSSFIYFSYYDSTTITPSISSFTVLFNSKNKSFTEPFACALRHFVSLIFAPQWYFTWIPALLYTLQNMLQYVALTYMDAASYQVTYQLKLLTTAICSVMVFNKKLTLHQWIALCILTLGVMLVQWSPSSSSSTIKITSMNKEPVVTGSWPSFGLFCVLLSCCLSGFTGVYVEKLIKSPSTTNVWVRNLQLSFFAMVTSFTYLLCSEMLVSISFNDFLTSFGSFSFWFQGFTLWTFLAILCQALVGLTVAMVMKYADTILKGFATSCSIVLSSLISMYAFDFQWTYWFILGASLVIVATFLYGYQLTPTETNKRTQRNKRHRFKRRGFFFHSPSTSSSSFFSKKLKSIRLWNPFHRMWLYFNTFFSSSSSSSSTSFDSTHTHVSISMPPLLMDTPKRNESGVCV